MVYSNQMLLIIVSLIVASVAVTALANWFYRRRGGVAVGWAGALFIGLCWIAAFALIIHRTIH